jgi:dihydrofolate synthase / folylpolyglutamate synthase
MSYRETLNYLYSQLPMYHRIGKVAYKNNLDNAIKLDEYFNYPHKNYLTIHVAGTNGKGSVSHMLASVFQSAGYKTGLYTSPHLKDFRERIKINGKMISKKYVVNFIDENKSIFHKIQPSFFEMTVALAFKYFADKKVDVVIVETGLGGRLDSTNIITPCISVITNISLDHTELLGHSLKEIAVEKAGIIKKNIPVIIGETDNETKTVFINKAEENKSDIYFAGDYFNITKESLISFDKLSLNIRGKGVVYKNLICDLTGDYQKKNIITALTVIDVLKQSNLQISRQCIKEGFSNVISKTGLKGRWQKLNDKPLIICDTGHNEGGIKFIVNQLKSLKHDRLHIIIGMVNDKDIDSILYLLPKDAVYYFTKAKIPRALDEKILSEKASHFGLSGNTYPTVKRALNDAKTKASENDLIFIGGSTFVVAEAI